MHLIVQICSYELQNFSSDFIFASRIVIRLTYSIYNTLVNSKAKQSISRYWRDQSGSVTNNSTLGRSSVTES